MSIDPQLKIDEINKIENQRFFGAILNYLDRFNPFTMAEDKSQQWLAAFDCCTVHGPKLIEDKNKRIAELETNLENTRLVCDLMSEEWRMESEQNGHALNNANIMKIGVMEAQAKLKDKKIAELEEKLVQAKERALEAERVIQTGWIQNVETARKSGFEEMRQAAIEIVGFEMYHEMVSTIHQKIFERLKHVAMKSQADLRNAAIAEAIKPGTAHE